MIDKLANKWIWTAVGGTSAMLLGGVAAKYEPEVIAKLTGKNDSSQSKTDNAEQSESTAGDDLPIADVNDDMSFDEAFASAREEVGPGGVFYWHGGIYGTYYEDEWNEMTDEEKADFGEQAYEMFPEANNPDDVVMPEEVEQAAVVPPADPGVESPVQAHNGNGVEQPVDQPGEPQAQVVGYSSVEGHLTAEIDTDGDGVVDHLVVDTDNSWDLTPKDVVVDRDGNAYSVGNLVNGGQASQDSQASNNEGANDDDGIAVVGYGEYDGHLVVGYDSTGNGDSDFVVIDVDDDGVFSQNDVVVDQDGNSATLGELATAASEENDLEDDDADDLSDGEDDDFVHL